MFADDLVEVRAAAFGCPRLRACDARPAVGQTLVGPAPEKTGGDFHPSSALPALLTRKVEHAVERHDARQLAARRHRARAGQRCRRSAAFR